MPETFDAFEYLGYLKQRWSFVAKAVIAAVVLTLIAGWLMTPTYTATATMVIEPPAGSDPRASTAVSAVYLESLKSYEEFASSDTLFAKAAAKFQLLNGSAVETVKRRVLRVNKPQTTNVLEIAVTLPDAKQAQAMAQYLAEETVALTRSVAQVGERDARTEIETQLTQAREELEKTRTEQTSAESAGSVAAIEAETRDLADLRFRISEQLISANALLAEQNNGTDAASSRARIAVKQ